MQHLSVVITGNVQGVFFRDSARHHAERLDVTGTIHNEMDGSVHLEIEGTKKALQEFIEWCHDGPPGAVVSDVQVTDGDVQGYDRFEILYD